MHSFLERSGILPTIRLFRRAAGDFGSDGAGSMAAALAFHTTISLVPLLLIFITLAGLFYPDEIVDGQVVEQAQTYIGTEAAQLAENKELIQKLAGAGQSGARCDNQSTSAAVSRTERVMTPSTIIPIGISLS